MSRSESVSDLATCQDLAASADDKFQVTDNSGISRTRDWQIPKVPLVQARLCHYKLTRDLRELFVESHGGSETRNVAFLLFPSLGIRVGSWAGQGLLMATTLYQTSPELRQEVFVEHWFFTGMAIAMLATSTAGFMPSLVHTAGRRAPLSPLAAAHGLVFFAWLLIFLVQSRLVATRRVAWHRRLGLAAVFLLALMIPLAYSTTIAMVRRSFDLSGDLRIDHDPLYESIFPFGDITIFAVLVIAALAYRRRPEIHKRLMLFANIELMPAPLAHLIGHTPWLALLPAAIVMIPISIFVIAAVARDLLLLRRVHPLTWGLAILRLVSGPLEAGPIGSSAAWHHFASWLAR